MWSDRNPQLVSHADILQFLASNFAQGEFNEDAS